MDVPIFTEKYFAKVQSQVYDDWEATAVEAMEEAAGREYDAAIAEGRVKDGIPVIDVYVDGAWCTAPMEITIGLFQESLQLLEGDSVRFLYRCENKYCLICARAEKKGETPKEHVCYKNYEGSSSGMETRVIINSVASKSRSLLENVDTNTVERLNSVIAKFVGGKRINWSLRRSYQSRCSAAVVAFNTKRPIYTLHKKILGTSPRGNLKKTQEKRDKKRNLTNLVPRKKNRKRQLFQKQNDYGESAAAPDMNEEEFKEAKTSFFERLKDLVKDRKSIEKQTVLQRDSSEWLELRKLILTASNFGKVIKGKKNYGNCVKQILYKKNISFVRSIAHGIEKENIALQQLAKQENIEIKPCGLFIDPEIDFLGASPDGIVGDDTVVEVKCPVAANKKGMRAAITENKIQILRYNKKTGNTTINKNSDWYFQAQGQLHVCRKKRCIFGIWGGEDQKLEILYINRDEDFWRKCMESKLKKKYLEHIIPEIVDSRQARGMPLRHTQPDSEEVTPCRPAVSGRARRAMHAGGASRGAANQAINDQNSDIVTSQY
ncbi:hypothetical protein EVAR_9749_1 [Eumeta japonica]|uniref:Uncharacterized protein n=1 Tax=Eumeta variegata TaxID=151549 RepID=A0A4C1U6I1_EUMVA|nr:hypothetical protein EVAR_9749_1 [Eumeta japonica]